MTQQIFSERAELVVDNFAGGGGASLGIETALGRPVDIAINHDAQAVAMHRANHPATRHFCQSVFDIDPEQVTDRLPVGLAWFSPDCRHFSKAKGGKPVEKNVRGLAWVVLRWASRVRPRVIVLENVEEFRTWGPLLADGMPCPRRKGQTFRQWWGHLESLGYRVESRELRACDYGTPTIRKRLFVVARRDHLPIVWPDPTHGAGLLPYRTAAEIIDWGLPCPSIFERKKELAPATLRRIANGIQRFVIDAAEPFIVRMGHYSNITGEGARFRGQPLSRPLSTVTAGGNDKALVVPLLSQFNKKSVARAASVPLSAIPTKNHHGLVTAFMAKHYGGVVGIPASVPLGTVTTQDHHAVVTSNLVKLRGTARHGQPVTEPVATITAGGNHLGEVRAFLMKYHRDGGQWQDVREPLHTVPTRDSFGLVMVAGEPWQIMDIGMRMLSKRELFRAQGFPENYIIDPVVNGKPLPLYAQNRMCGNSVCPQVAEAVVRANYAELSAFNEASA